MKGASGACLEPKKLLDLWLQNVYLPTFLEHLLLTIYVEILINSLIFCKIIIHTKIFHFFKMYTHKIIDGLNPFSV